MIAALCWLLAVGIGSGSEGDRVAGGGVRPGGVMETKGGAERSIEDGTVEMYEWTGDGACEVRTDGIAVELTTPSGEEFGAIFRSPDFWPAFVSSVTVTEDEPQLVLSGTITVAQRGASVEVLVVPDTETRAVVDRAITFTFTVDRDDRVLDDFDGVDGPEIQGNGEDDPSIDRCPGGYCSCRRGDLDATACCPKGKTPECICGERRCCIGRCVKDSAAFDAEVDLL
jgi:hypothetical protein